MNIEQDIKAAGADVAPRVTPADIDANIEHIEYVKHVSRGGQVLRWAVITTKSGYAVVGRPSVSVSPENDRVEIGEKVALENSINEMWPLMGYALKDKLRTMQAPLTGQMIPLPVIDAITEDFPLGKACDLKGETGCEACQ